MNVLMIAAHPDDEVLGAGGTLARHARRGDHVHAVVLSEGASSRYEERMTRALEAAGRKAAGILGLASIRFERLPDQRLDTLPLIEITQRIEAIVEEVAPETVYIHHPGDVNADHGVAARAAWTACRPFRFPGVRRIAAFETPSSTEWGLPGAEQGFHPNLFVDIEETLPAKLAAFACYTSEVREHPHPRSLRALEIRAAAWGGVAGRAAVEPFMILRTID
jgi:LmbE family N-acetylglucosaminyl deacetylase